MAISYVVRLRPDELVGGRFVGEIETVASRRRSSISTIEQMTSFILETMAGQLREHAAARSPEAGEPQVDESVDPRAGRLVVRTA